MECLSYSEKDTETFAADCARRVKDGTVVLLSGDLGMGKSVFARAFIRTLAEDPALVIPSPTFTLAQTYDTPRGLLWHFDLYRLARAQDVYETGWEAALAGGGIVLVEWPERLEGLAPRDAVQVSFSGEGEMRRIVATGACFCDILENALPARKKYKAIENAFVLAAGLGTRLRPFTDTQPKPMVPVWGKPLIDHALDRLEDAGVGHIWVNLYHYGTVLERHLRARKSPKITFSWEESLLNTGGGLRAVRDALGSDALYILNGDSLWTDGGGDPALTRLAAFWDDARMDILLLLYPLTRMRLTRATGDYDFIGPEGSLKRNREKSGPYAFTGVRIAHPRILDDTPDGPFPFLDLMDRAEREGRLFGMVHTGAWHHISTLADREAVEREGLVSGQMRLKERP